MKQLSWRLPLLLAGAFTLAPTLPARAQEPAEIPIPGGAEIDDPTARLRAQTETFGVVTPAYRKAEIKQVNIHNTKKNAPGPRWVNIGPTGADFEQNGTFSGHVRDSGRIRTILYHPSEEGIVYVLTSGGGLWRTNNWTDANTTWTPLSDNLATTGGGAVAFGANANTLYLGLGDPYDQILAGGAVVKSTNGGVSWSAIQELGNAASVRDIQVDASTGGGGKKGASKSGDVVLVATDQGLFRSADEGSSYAAINTFSTQSVWSVVKSSAGWLASSQPCAVNLNSTRPYGVLCGQTNPANFTRLYRSSDRGATWAPIPNTGGGFTNSGRTTLAVGKPGDAVVYAYSSSVDETQLNDVFRSTDGGLTWAGTGTNATKAPTNPVAGSQTNMSICGAQCWYDQSIVVDPFDSSRNTVWIGGNLATAQTTNGGGAWTLKTWWLYSQVPELPYAHADHHAAIFKTTGTPTLILGNDGGLNISTDGGTTFSSDKNNGLATHLYYSIAGNAKIPNFVIGGLQDNGTRARLDGNGTIYNQVIGGDGVGAAASIDNTNTIMGSSQSSGIRMYLTNTIPDVYQNAVSRGTLSDTGAPFATCLVPAPAGLDPTGRVFFHFTNNRVWRTNNGGQSFILLGSTIAPISPGLPAGRAFRSSVTNLSVSPQDLNHIAVGAGGGFIDVTADGGATWTDINMTTKANFTGFVTGLTWEDNQNLWVTSSALVGNNLARVVKGHINNPGDPWSGATWTVLQSGLPDLPVQHVLFDPRDPHNTIFAASHVGIYRSTNGGSSWAPYGNGLPTVRVGQIYMPPDGSFIRIATYGRGNWELGQLELVDSTLTDDTLSCDHDGYVDNGEVGTLRVRLINQGANNVNQGTIKFSSTNPHVTFPNGSVINAPGIGPKTTATVSIAVAVNGAIGIEAADFKIALDIPQLAVGSDINLSSTQLVNVDDHAGISATDTFESKTSAWTLTGTAPEPPNALAARIRALSPIQHALWLPDSNGQNDDVRDVSVDTVYATSPVLSVDPANPLVISFNHRYNFEAGGWDGGILEVSTDGGASWTKVGTSPAFYNGLTNAGTSSTIGAGTAAFVNKSTNWPAFIPASINLGTSYAGMSIQIRFHGSSDEGTGAPGWDIDDVAISGITNTPFSGLVAQGTCP